MRAETVRTMPFAVEALPSKPQRHELHRGADDLRAVALFLALGDVLI
jgi:hypothetical protein